jgi:hypothetical protein
MRLRRIGLFPRKQRMAEPLVVNRWRTFIDSCHSRLFHQIDRYRSGPVQQKA